jgi:hypothetical protein
MNAAISTLTRVSVTLFAYLAFVAGHGGAVARDCGYDGGGFVALDHCTSVIVRDHRTVPVIRGHRTTPIVRDHRVPRGPKGGVTVTSSESRRGGSPCIRSVFGGSCFRLGCGAGEQARMSRRPRFQRERPL